MPNIAFSFFIFLSYFFYFFEESIFLTHNKYPQSTPLHMASQNGNLEMIDFLLQQGAHLLETDAEGDTAEKVAANQEIVDFLSGISFHFFPFPP